MPRQPKGPLGSHGDGGVLRGFAWMASSLLLLGWIPVPCVGSVAAGFLCGWKARSIGRAIAAVMLLCLASVIALVLLFLADGGFTALLALIEVVPILMSVPGLLVGAVFGGMVVARRMQGRSRTLSALRR